MLEGSHSFQVGDFYFLLGDGLEMGHVHFSFVEGEFGMRVCAVGSVHLQDTFGRAENRRVLEQNPISFQFILPLSNELDGFLY